MSTQRPKVVTLGGGHGLHVMLSALVRLDVDVTAIVTVADDGGSSGRLRLEVPGIVPPGDLRMALTALSRPDDSGQLWSETFQHRFRGEGALAGHPVGNIVLVGLTQVLGDPVAALDAAGGAARRARPGAADGLRAAGHRGRGRGPGRGPDRGAPDPRAGGGRQHSRPGSIGDAGPARTRAPARRPWPRSPPRT